MAVKSRAMGAKIRALRRRHEMTQTKLAERLGISPSYLNLIEHGRRTLTAPLLIKVAGIFDLDLQSFSPDSDEQMVAALRLRLRGPAREVSDTNRKLPDPVVPPGAAEGARAVVPDAYDSEWKNFGEAVQKLHFTNGADKEVVASLYESTLRAAFGGATELAFRSCGWDD